MSSSAPLTARSVNARIDALNKVPLGVGGFIGLLLCYLFANYDISVFALVVPSLLREFGLEAVDLGAPVFWNLAGYGVGAYFFGYIADRWGRQRGLLLTIVILAIGSFLSAVSWDIASFSLFRFIAGAGMGAVLAVCSAYISELAPARMRGRYLSVLYTVQAVLLLIIGLVSLPALKLGEAEGVLPYGWRILLAFGGLVIVAVFFLNDRGMIESPRWLVESGRVDHAARNLDILEARVGHGEMPDFEEEQPIEPLVEGDDRVRPLQELMRPPYVGRLAVVLSFWLLYYVAAYGWLSYTTVILGEFGISEEDSLFQTVFSRATGIVVPFLFIWLIEKVERRTLIILGTAMMIVGFATLFLPIGDVRGLIASVVVSLGISFVVTPGYIYTVEIFSTKSRSTAGSIADGVGHMGGAIAPFIVLPVLATLGGVAGVATLIGAAVVAGGIMMFGPRTKGRSLDEINKPSGATAEASVPALKERNPQ